MFIILLIGYISSKFIKDTSDFILAGRRLGFILSTGAVFATWFGAETSMGASYTASREGILGVIADPYGAGLCLIIASFIVKKLFELNVKTVVDFFEIKYGKNIAKLFTLFYIPSYVGWIGAQMLALGNIVFSITGFDFETSIYISSLIIVLYTVLGGMWSVTLTDFIQVTFIMSGFFIIALKIIPQMYYSNINPELFKVLPNPHILDILNYIEAWLIVGVGSLPAQDLIQRIMAAKDVKTSRRALITAGILYWI
ncbi:MAG: sodium:solute symporter, partial [bacterium]|nr:sodium:solute symporter [bacterium]